jgi:hypothetical protein
LLPPVERLLRNPEVADEVGNGGPHLRLLEYRHNLLDTESFSFHGILLPHPGASMPETLLHIGLKIGEPTKLACIMFVVQQTGFLVETLGQLLLTQSA